MGSNKDFAFVAPDADGFTPDHPAAEHLVIEDADEGLIRWTRKKIAICGFASSTRQYIPIADPAWTIFTLNQLYRHLARSDVHFDIHGHWEEGNVEGTDHPRWLAECGIPVFMVKREANIPTSVKFPIERLIAKHGIDYFTSTIAFQICYAIDLIDREVERRAKEVLAGQDHLWDAHQLVRSLYAEYTIALFGIDLIVGTEYERQKPCAEFWLGQAESRGIFILLPPETALLKQQYRYGYQREVNVGLVSLAEYQTRQAALDKRKQEAIAQLHTLGGALQELHRIKEAKVAAGEPVPEGLVQRMTELVNERDRSVSLAQTLDGAQQENRHVHDVLELRSRGGAIPLGV